MGTRTLLIFVVATCYVTMSNAKPSVSTTGVSPHTFTDNLSKVITEEEIGNLIFSSRGVTKDLAMVAFGARGDTEKELRSVIPVPNRGNQTQRRPRPPVYSYEDYSEGGPYRRTNWIFMEDEPMPKYDFIKSIWDTFTDRVENSQVSDPDSARNHVNQRMSDMTTHHILDVVRPDQYDPKTFIVNMNTAYVDAKWIGVSPSQTKDGFFHLSETTIKYLPTVYRIPNSRYVEIPEVDAMLIELPSHNPKEVDIPNMVIIIPNTIEGLAQLEENLDQVRIDELLSSMEISPEYTDVLLPQFKLNSTIDLQEPLEKLGLRNMFTDKANFTAIIDDPQIHIDVAMQKSCIEVNEEGFEVASVTTVHGITTPKSLSTTPESTSVPEACYESSKTIWAPNVTRTPTTATKRFIGAVHAIDRPFIFMIVRNGETIIQARVVDPTSN